MNQLLFVQQGQIVELQTAVQQLNQEITQLKGTSPIHIDKVEYHFDQLKVEELKGTLSIGFSPNTLGEQIEDLNVNGKDIHAPSSEVNVGSTGQYPWGDIIMKKVQEYMEHQFERDLAIASKQSNIPIDAEFYPLLTEDIHKQIEPRIRYYCEQNAPFINAENEHTHVERISKQVIQDIHEAIKNFLRGNQMKKEDG